MGSWNIAVSRVATWAMSQHVILGSEVIRVWSRISRGALVPLVAHKMPISVVHVVSLLLFRVSSLHLLRWGALVKIAFALLVNNFLRIINVVELNAFLSKIFG